MRTGKTIDQRRLDCRELGWRQALMTLGHASEAVELGAVALQRYDERAVGDRAWVRVAPEGEATAAEIAHNELRALLLAIRREHDTGIEAAAMHERPG